MGQMKNVYMNGLGHLSFFIAQLPGDGEFSRNFTINLPPQYRVFSGVLQTEKLQSPLFHGAIGALISND